MVLTLEQAGALITAATRAAADQNAQLSVAVVDLSGRLVAFARMTGAAPLTADISHSKAVSAVLLHGDTRDFTSATALTTAVAYPLALVPGGVLVRDEAGSPVGALGVAGSSPETDHAVARAAAALPQPVPGLTRWTSRTR